MPYQYEAPVYGNHFTTQRSLDPRDPANRNVVPHPSCGKNFENLLAALDELNIRFDTSPRNYLKNDYLHLLKVLRDSFTYLYLEPQVPNNLEKTEYSLFWPIQRWKLEKAVHGVFSGEGDNLLLQDSDPYYERLAAGDFHDRIGEETLNKLWEEVNNE